MGDDPIHLDISIRLVASLAIGALIGLERTYHGRPAGFRTHALVCLSTSLLMLVTFYETHWFPGTSQGRLVLDPTRMAQGIMTGVGFLGAGTIMREGLSVRGLTTAASLWITAAIGILVGIGFFFPAILSTVLTLGTLSVFRWLEKRIPAQFYAQLTLRFPAQAPMPEPDLRRLLKEYGFTASQPSYRLDPAADFFEYCMTIRSSSAKRAREFTDALSRLDAVKEFRIEPMGD